MCALKTYFCMYICECVNHMTFLCESSCSVWTVWVLCATVVQLRCSELQGICTHRRRSDKYHQRQEAVVLYTCHSAKCHTSIKCIFRGTEKKSSMGKKMVSCKKLELVILLRVKPEGEWKRHSSGEITFQSLWLTGQLQYLFGYTEKGQQASLSLDSPVWDCIDLNSWVTVPGRFISANIIGTRKTCQPSFTGRRTSEERWWKWILPRCFHQRQAAQRAAQNQLTAEPKLSDWHFN